MNQLLAAIAGLGGVLKAISGFVVFGFLIWSMYFTGSYELTFFKGILAFVVLSIFVGFTSMIPFGTTLAPILFEWWWHDVRFWEFSAAAWVVTGVSMIANILLLAAVLLESRNRN
jgi:hypothetical protein